MADDHLEALIGVGAKHALDVRVRHVFGVGGFVAFFLELLHCIVTGIIPGVIVPGAGQDDGDFALGFVGGSFFLDRGIISRCFFFAGCVLAWDISRSASSHREQGNENQRNNRQLCQ